MKRLKRIKHIFTNQTPWMSNFTSALSGTILGIVLTFGINAYLQEKIRKESSIKAIAFSLSNIKRYIDDIKFEIEVVQRTDSLYANLYKYFPDRADKANIDTIRMCENRINTYSFIGMDNSAHTIFSNSMETIDNSDNLEMLEDIGDCFAIIDLYKYEQKHTDEIREELITEYLNIANPKNYSNPILTADTYFKTPGFEYFILRHKLYKGILTDLLYDIKCSYNYADSAFCKITGTEPESIQ